MSERDATNLDRRIARQHLKIEQVRFHLEELAPESPGFVSALRWLVQLEQGLAGLKQLPPDPRAPSQQRSLH
jgi:hypothetical protein